MSMASKRNKFASKLVFALVLALVLLAAVSCGKKEEKVEVPVTTTVTEVKKSEPVAPVKETAPVVEAPVQEEAPVVEAPVVEVEEPVVVEPVAEPVAEIEEVDNAPIVIEKTIGGVTYKLEAYDGFGYIYYPESYADDKVDAFVESLVNANPEIVDQVGWVVEEPGMVIVAYPFGLTEAELNAYATAVETMFK